MSKKYLIDDTESHTRNGFRICEECDAKEVEVLDDSQVNQMLCDSIESDSDWFSDYLKANNLQIIKIKE